jgi:hypothetical protein
MTDIGYMIWLVATAIMTATGLTVGTLAGARQRGGPADPARGAGEEHGLSAQVADGCSQHGRTLARLV